MSKLPKTFRQRSEIFQQTSCNFFNFKACFPNWEFFSKCSSQHLECSIDKPAKNQCKKLKLFCSESDKAWKNTKTLKNIVFSPENFLWTHVESSMYNCAEKISPNYGKIVAHCQEKVTKQKILREYCFLSNVTQQLECTSDKTAGNFPPKIPRLPEKNSIWRLFPKVEFFTKSSSGHLECSFYNPVKNSLKKNWKSFALNPLIDENLQKLSKTKFSAQSWKSQLFLL